MATANSALDTNTNIEPGTAKRLSTWRALNAALHQSMERDTSVMIMGEDMTKWGAGGGIYGVTKGLLQAFGPQRVRDTPISEEAIVSAAVGAAMCGVRPIVEIMYSDFSMLAMDAIVNQAAKAHYMFGGQFNVPMVIRTNGGSGMGKAAQHSQSLETIFAHIPGLEVVVPGTPGDAFGLLLTAIESPNPTIFLEHKALYEDRGPVEDIAIPFGVAAIAREGKDITVVATQLMRKRSMEAAEILSLEGVDVEIIDPRTLYPLDMNTILASVRKTRRVIVIHEAPELYGFGSELIARVSQELWSLLKTAPRRLGGARTPVPYAEQLEKAVLPDTLRIVAEIRDAIR